MNEAVNIEAQIVEEDNAEMLFVDELQGQGNVET